MPKRPSLVKQLQDCLNSKLKIGHSKFEDSLIKNELPIYLELSKDNKFLVIYNHPKSDKYHIKVVIFVKNLDEIRLVTTFPTEKRKMRIL
jgi:hypothetical protein